MPIVMMSNCPPLVEMSVATRCRSTFSSSTSHFSFMPVAFSNFEAYFCITTMSGLFTVAIVRVVSARAAALAAKRAAAATENNVFDLTVSSLVLLRHKRRLMFIGSAGRVAAWTSNEAPGEGDGETSSHGGDRGCDV